MGTGIPKEKLMHCETVLDISKLNKRLSLKCGGPVRMKNFHIRIELFIYEGSNTIMESPYV